MSTLHILFLAWGVVTAVLICLVIYRSTLSTREGDQIFLNSSASSIADEQRAIVSKLQKLSAPITALIVISAVLLLVTAGFWLYQGYKSF